MGLSPLAPGAYAEQVLAEGAMSFVVPNGLDPNIAALTEPMAVALHAVQRSDITKRDVAVVVGCGPVGLAVICHLKAKGVETIVASDFSPGRRTLAQRCGADIVVDPAQDSPYDSVGARKGVVTSVTDLSELGVSSMEKLRKLPGWSHIYRIADKLGAAAPKRPVIFECVGVPGVIDSILVAAPFNSRIVVAGVCMGTDQFRPTVAIGKEIDLRFVFGYTPLEFRDTLYLLADGKLDAAALVTGTVGLAGVDAAFGALGNPETHAKIVIDPQSAISQV
jgi:threonine dehydrogenase-like Zn-dependent dehydrogenase